MADDALRRMSRHVRYEYVMAVQSIAALLRSPALRSPQQEALRNAWIECFLLHSRNLIDFFGRPGRDDDVTVNHYVDDWVAHVDGGSELARLDSDLRRHINKHIAHLSFERLDPPGDPPLDRAMADIDALWTRFMGRLSPDRRPWFEVPPPADS